MNREVDFDKVVSILRSYYNQALQDEYIKVPIAWALYQTWKAYDRRK